MRVAPAPKDAGDEHSVVTLPPSGGAAEAGEILGVEGEEVTSRGYTGPQDAPMAGVGMVGNAASEEAVAINIPLGAEGKKDALVHASGSWARWCGHDADGVRVLLINGCEFDASKRGDPSHCAEAVCALLRARSGAIQWGAMGSTVFDDPEPTGAPESAVRPFCVVYCHAGVGFFRNAPGVGWLRTFWEALPGEVQGALTKCYLLHMSLDLRLGVGLFAPRASWPKMLHVDRLQHLWRHMDRQTAKIKFNHIVHEHERVLDAQPLYDYGIGVPKVIPDEIVSTWVSDPLGLRNVCI